MGKYMNTALALENVRSLIMTAEANKREVPVWNGWRYYPSRRTRTTYPVFKIREVYRQLGIFDWWNEDLSFSQLKQMERFLVTAQKLGFNGYVCFKVGRSGCSHGMWAHRAESTDGYSPDGECLHHSFVPGENYWDYCNADGKWMATREKWQFTLAEVKRAIYGV